jgi:hypothetical protein
LCCRRLACICRAGGTPAPQVPACVPPAAPNWPCSGRDISP